MKKTIFYPLLLLLILLSSLGCSSTTQGPHYSIEINAISKDGKYIPPSHYMIKPLRSSINPEDLYFQQYRNHLATLLNDMGYKPVENASEAQQIIYFDYGIEKIKESKVTYHEPNLWLGMSWGFPHRRHHHPRLYHDPFWRDIRYGSYRTYQENYQLFNRHITLLSKDPSNKELWRIDASSVGEEQNLRTIVPLLLNAVSPYIGSNYDTTIKLSIPQKTIKKE